MLRARAAVLLGVWLAAMSARADVILDPTGVTVDYGNHLDPGLVQVIDIVDPEITSLSPIPGWTGVKIAGLAVTWEFLLDAPEDFPLHTLSVSIKGSASGLVVTDRVLMEWTDLYVTGPEALEYGIWFFAGYDHSGQAEGYGATLGGWPNGGFWLDTRVGRENGTSIVSWELRVDVQLPRPPRVGERYTLEIGGHSFDAGTASVLAVVPEPGSASLAGLGLIALGAMRLAARRRVLCTRCSAGSNPLRASSSSAKRPSAR